MTSYNNDSTLLMHAHGPQLHNGQLTNQKREGRMKAPWKETSKGTQPLRVGDAFVMPS